MTCVGFASDLEDFLSGALSPDRETSAREHLMECSSCQRMAEKREPALLFSRLAEPETGSTGRPSTSDLEFLAGVRQGIALHQTEERLEPHRGLPSWWRRAAIYALLAIGASTALRLTARPQPAPAPVPGVVAMASQASGQKWHQVEPVAFDARPAIENLDRVDARGV